MNTQTILAVVLGLFVAFVIWDKVWPRIKALLEAKNARTSTMVDLTVAINKLTDALNGDESTKMIAGTLKACEAIAAATVELRDEIAAFGKIVRIDDKPYPPDHIIQPPDRAADEKVATFLEAIARGRNVGDAMQEAKDLQDTKTMFSAVSMDPMGEQQS